MTCSVTRFHLHTLPCLPRQQQTSCPTCAASFVVCRTAHHVRSNRRPTFLFPLLFLLVSAPTHPGRRRRRRVSPPVCRARGGLYVRAALHRHPAVRRQKRVPTGPGWSPVVAPCSARGPYGVLRWYSVRGILAASAALEKCHSYPGVRPIRYGQANSTSQIAACSVASSKILKHAAKVRVYKCARLVSGYAALGTCKY